MNPATLVAAHLAGAQRLFKIGGPWAIGSLAYGTELVPRVDKIVGPGNKYVTAAKLLVFGQVDIDSPAGPSEALILADETAEPRFLALDFLSQVEHDPEAAAVLVTPSAELAQKVVDLIVSELPHLPRREIIEAALGKYSAALVVENLDEAIDFANLYAAEHLQIVTREPFAILPRIRHAGSIFLGPYAPVPVGDYASGTNHVLPTGRLRPDVFRPVGGRFHQEAHLPAPVPGGPGGPEGHGDHPGGERRAADPRPGRGRALQVCLSAWPIRQDRSHADP